MSHADAAGLLLFRTADGGTEVFLVHPGGPYWRHKDVGAWSVPKGIYDRGEEPLAAARREFTEETGFTVDGPFIPLGAFKIRPGKTVTAFAAEGDCIAADLISNTFQLEWPPKSGRFQDFPEVDRGGWFDEKEALVKIAPGQRQIIETFYEQVVRRRPAPAASPSQPKRPRTAGSAARGPKPAHVRDQK